MIDCILEICIGYSCFNHMYNKQRKKLNNFIDELYFKKWVPSK